MVRYQVILTYDGTEFHGFQRQEKVRTVQQEVEAALQRVGWRGKSLLAAGRTDTGVHAQGQVIAFDLEWIHSLEELQRAINANLPLDVAALAVKQVPADFHPRYSAKGRRYRYRLFCDEVRQPLRERYAWRVWPQVDLNRMQEAARGLTGKHDFAAFGKSPWVGGSTTREISQAEWRTHEKDLVFEIVGNAFLYRMVRRLVYLMVEIGQSKRDPGVIVQYLVDPKQKPFQGIAPPQGLFLSEVFYPLQAF